MAGETKRVPQICVHISLSVYMSQCLYTHNSLGVHIYVGITSIFFTFLGYKSCFSIQFGDIVGQIIVWCPIL